MHDHIILRVITKLLMPFIFLFALYVQFHGDYGPGGGFQAGVIFATGLILYALIFGLRSAKKVTPPRVLRVQLALGVLLYAGVGVVGIMSGAEYLNYDVLAEDAHSGQHLGILLVELGVGLTVSAAMTLIFFLFAGQEQ
ncbi:MAG: Na(+)/H(+) antiporter subunit B [Alphaproteobacteria bacterium]|nr:Na(+)/H(+) antiporter subunit B [Alphaproteobacteria bacterium]